MAHSLPVATTIHKNWISTVLTRLLEHSVDLGVRIGLNVVRLLFPLARSPRGYANPRVRHITSWTYFYYLHTVVKPNIEKWLAGRGDLFPHVIQVQTINRCNAACQ